MAEVDYDIWRLSQETGEAELAAMAVQQAAFEVRPTISLLLPVGEVDEIWLRDGIASLARQVYPEWELCVYQRGARARVQDMLPSDPALVTRIRAIEPGAADPTTGEALEAALNAASGEYVAILGEGDELAPDALFRMVEAVQSSNADIVYTDEDSIDHLGRHTDPVLKTDWSPDQMLTSPYVGRLCAVRRELLLTDPGGPTVRSGELTEFDTMLRAAEQATTVVHVPTVLYHRRLVASAPGPDAARLMADDSDGLVNVVETALARRGDDARVRSVARRPAVRLLREPDWSMPISLIVQTGRRGQNVALLRQLLERSSAHEVIAVSPEPMRPGVDDMKLIVDRSLARAANRAAADATGEVLLFIDGRAALGQAGIGGLDEMVAQAFRDGIGAVSGRVVNGDGTLRHGGRVIDLADLLESPDHEPEPEDAETLGTRELLNPGAATDELLAISASTFEEVGGFDEAHLVNRFHGLDLSLRLEDRGLRSVYTPYAALLTRGPRRVPDVPEVAYMWERWAPELARLHSNRWPPNDARHQPRAAVFTDPRFVGVEP